MCDVYPTIWDGKGALIGHTIAARSFNRDIFSRTNFGLFFYVLLFLWKPASDSSEPEFVNFSRSPGIDSQSGGPVRQPYLTYRSTRLHMLAESVPWNRFLGSLNVYKYGLRNAVSSGGVAGYRERLARPRGKTGRHQVS